jgi:hypothetical protein
MTFTPQQLTDLSIKGPFKIILTPSDTNEISITTDEALFECIETKENGNLFSLSYKCMGNFNVFGLVFFGWKSPKSNITIHVAFQQLKKLELAGASDTHTSYPIISSEDFLLKISGASNADLNLTAPKIETKVSGASTLTLTAKSEDLDLKASGASKMYTNGNSESIRAEVNGTSSLTLTTQSKDLQFKTNGASKISANGSGESVSIEAQGASTVDASNLTVEKAELTANGTSIIKVRAKEVLSSTATGTSSIENVQ